MKTARFTIIASRLASATALATALTASPALATGTPAGTLIQNTASASYTSGTTTGSVSSNTVTVKVDQLLNVAVAALNSTPVAVSTTAGVLSYQVTNTGNGSDTFDLTADPNVSGNAFNGVIQSVAVDTNGNGSYDPGVDAIITNGSASPAILADGSLKVFVLVTLPPAATDGQTAKVKLTGASVIGTGTPGTVFAGKGIGGVDAVVGASTATANALDAIVASLAGVSLTKTATIADPFGGTAPIPGAVINYSLVAHVSGTGTATNLHVTDSYPAGTTYQPGSMTLGGAALTDAVDGDAGTATASGIDVALGNITGGSPDKTVTFKVKIN